MPIRKEIGNGDLMKRFNYLIHHIYPAHENKKMKGRVRERHQKISGEVGNLEITINGTNKMRVYI